MMSSTESALPFMDPVLSKTYRKLRPSYPPELFNAIVVYLTEKVSGPFAQAVDVGCGTGQGTLGLAQHFSDVIGVDISPSQIAEASSQASSGNVQYRLGSFDDLPVAKESTDLVTCAMAAHWFDPIERFYEEADRVLKPQGVLAMCGYDVPRVHVSGHGNETFTEELRKFYHSDILARYKRGRAYIVDNLYRDLVLPYPNRTRSDTLSTDVQCTLADLCESIQSWSFYWRYKADSPTGPDPLQELVDKFQSLVGPGCSLDDCECTLTYPIYLLMGRKPAS